MNKIRKVYLATALLVVAPLSSGSADEHLSCAPLSSETDANMEGHTAKQIVFFSGFVEPAKVGLWQTNGTAGGTSEIPVNGASASLGLRPQYFSALNGKVLFGGTGASGNQGLWQTDGTSAGTFEIPVNGASAKGVTVTLFGFTIFNGKALFRGANATGQLGLWQTDGASAGTIEIPVAGAGANGVSPNNFGPQKGKLLFRGNSPGNRSELWQTDGTSAGTKEISVSGASSLGLQPQFLTPLNGKLLFLGWTPSKTSKFIGGLWQTDGTSPGTVEIVVPGANSTPGDNGLNPGRMTPLNGKLLFAGVNAARKFGLWQTDGTTIGTSEIAVNGAGPNGLSPNHFTPLKGKLLFNGINAASRHGLWQTDGTTAGTSEIPVNGASMGGTVHIGLDPSSFSPLNGKLLFAGSNVKSVGIYQSLWQTDGTFAGTSEIPITGGYVEGVTPNMLASFLCEIRNP